MAYMVTKAELVQQLKEAQAVIDSLEAQTKAKPVVVTARVPLALREDMKRAGMQNGENLQEFMVNAFTERLEKLKAKNENEG